MQVYAIKNRMTGKLYACKCFEKDKIFAMDKGMVFFKYFFKIQVSLFNEIEIMRALPDHKNIVKLREVYEGENTYYLVMDISEGKSLYDEIKSHQEKPFTPKEILQIIKDLSEGIACCAS